MDLYFIEDIKILFLEYIYYIMFFAIFFLLIILNTKSNAYKRKKEMQISLKTKEPEKRRNKNKNINITKSKLVFEDNIFLLNDKLKIYNMSDGKKEVKDSNFIIILLEDKLEQKGYLNKLEKDAYNKYYERINVVSPVNYSNKGTFESDDDNFIEEENLIHAPPKTIYDDDVYEFGGERLD